MKGAFDDPIGGGKTASSLPPGTSGQTAIYFDTKLIALPPGYPEAKPVVVDALLPSIREHGQLVPAFVGRSASLPADHREIIEGVHRLAVAGHPGLPLLAFDLDREHSRAEMIMLTMQFNHARRVMSREEVALLGSEFMEETGCTAAQRI